MNTLYKPLFCISDSRTLAVPSSRLTVTTGDPLQVNLEILKATAAALMDEWPKAGIPANKMFAKGCASDIKEHG